MAFCLPCNHYNTSFPLASRCLDTHGETQPGTTRSIKGCPLQREREKFISHCAEAKRKRRNLSVILQKPCTPHFQTDPEKGNDGLLQALLQKLGPTNGKKRTPLNSRKGHSLKLDLNVENNREAVCSLQFLLGHSGWEKLLPFVMNSCQGLPWQGTHRCPPHLPSRQSTS